jgi:hypothetical protein
MPDVLQRLRDYLQIHPVGRDIAGQSFELFPPCDEAAIEDAESAIGFRLPSLLIGIYTKIANGGFGPGYGVMGVAGGFTDDLQQTIVDAYKSYDATQPGEPAWKWPHGWVPFCHWGCIIYSVLDCLRPPHPVYFMGMADKQPDAPMDSIIHPHKPSLALWLDDWMDGKNLWAEVWH